MNEEQLKKEWEEKFKDYEYDCPLNLFSKWWLNKIEIEQEKYQTELFHIMKATIESDFDQKLTSYKASLLEAGEGMKKEIGFVLTGKQHEEVGYNQAITDYQNLIKE